MGKKEEKKKELLTELKRLASASKENNFDIVLNPDDFSREDAEIVRLVNKTMLNYRTAVEYDLMKHKVTSDTLNIALWKMDVENAKDPANTKNRFTWSQEFRQMLGFSDEHDFPDVLSSWSDRIHPEDKEKTLNVLAAHFSDYTGKTPYDVEYRLMMKSGYYRHFHAYGATFRDKDGVPLKVSGALMDIEEEKNMQNQLMVMSSIVHNSPHFISYKKINGECLYINPAVSLITGYTRDELIKDYLSILFGDETKKNISEKVIKDLKESGVSRYEVTGKTKQGEEKVFKGTSFLVEKEIYATIAEDITAVKKSEIEKIETLKALEYSKKLTDTLNGMAKLFLSRSEKSFEDMMSDGIQLLADLVDADRFSVFRNYTKDGVLYMSQKYRWDKTSGGTTDPNPAFIGLAYEDAAPSWKKIFLEGKTVNGPVKLMSKIETKTLKAVGMMSAFAAPIYINEAFWGFALFENHRTESVIGYDLAEMMRSAAFLCANAIIRSEMEYEINDQKKRTQKIIDTAPIGILIVDENFNIIDYNDAVTDIFGDITKQRFIRHFHELSSEYQPDGSKSIDKTFDIYKRALNGEKLTLEWTYLSAAGDLIPCEIMLTRIKHNNKYVALVYIYDLRNIKKMERAVSDAEMAQILLDTMPFNANLIDKNFNIIDCNQETVRLFGLKDKQEYINNFYSFSPEYQPCGKRSKEMAAENFKKAFDEGYHRLEWMHQTINGDLIPCEVTLVRIKYKDDAALAGYTHDLREIKASIEKIRTAEERTQVMFDATPLSISLFDKDFNVIDCNQETIYLYGIPDKQEFLDDFYAFSPKYQPCGKLTKDKVAEVGQKAMDEGYHRFEWVHKNKKGDLIPCDITLVRIIYKGDNALAGYARDIRDAKAVTEKLREADERTRIMLDATPLSCSLIDDNYRVIDCNSEVQKLFGVSNKQEFLDDFFKFSPQFQPDGQNSQDKAYGLFEKTFVEGHAKFDWLHINSGGEFIPCEVTFVRVRYKDNYIIAAYTRDMREIKAKEAEVHKAIKEKAEAEAISLTKSDFLARVSHEIRTPMNAILGITEIQLQNESITPDTEEAFGRIYNSGYLLLGIINEILDLSKIEAGKLELVPVKYDVASLIHDTVQLNITRNDSKAIDFNLEIDKNIPASLFGDELRIKQILNNLLSNAFKYTEKGTISLSVSVDADNGHTESITLVFRVSDTGQGMTEDEVDKLFTEYTRFNLNANRTTEGTGLGMNIARHLIQMMNGEIFVESERDKGSTFTVRLPQGKVDSGILSGEAVKNLKEFHINKTKIKSAPQITREYMPYGRVLVVDDVETNLFVIRGLLSPYGVSLETVMSGPDAIKKIEKGFSYDIIFMDHFMPVMDGIEAVKIIRELGYKHTIIALTANAVIGQSKVFLENGFDGFISKPIDIRQLNTLLNKFIRDIYPPETVKAAQKLKDSLKKKTDSGEPKTSKEMRAAFVRDAEKAIDAMETVNSYSYRRDDDVQLYIVYAHAMKGALANIGEAELSDFARKLEEGGLNNNTAMLLERTPVFLNELRALAEKMDQKEEEAGDEEINFTKDDRSFLHEKLLAVQEAGKAYDRKTAYDIVLELKEKTWPLQVRELLETIGEYLLHSDFDEAISAIDDYLTTLTLWENIA